LQFINKDYKTKKSQFKNKIHTAVVVVVVVVNNNNNNNNNNSGVDIELDYII